MKWKVYHIHKLKAKEIIKNLNIWINIRLIKNKKNKGTFISRNIGALYSKAEYIILPDPDDIISKDIIGICLYYAEKYKFEIIRYHSYKGNKQDIIFCNKIESRPIYQPELQTYLFYGNNELKRIDYYINNPTKKSNLMPL